MAVKRTRKEARERLIQSFMAALDQIVPEDESVALKGKSFRDFELQARMLKEAVIPALLEERAGVDGQAEAEAAGSCPHCGSDRTCLERERTKKEICSPDGMVVVERQQARCRACGGSFSPSGS